MIRRKRGTVPLLAQLNAFINASLARALRQNEKATRQQGGLFFKGE
jgi:hypothetical protein